MGLKIFCVDFYDWKIKEMDKEPLRRYLHPGGDDLKVSVGSASAVNMEVFLLGHVIRVVQYYPAETV